MELHQKSISARVYRWFIEQAETNGYDRSALCRMLGIDESALDSADARVSGDRHVQMVRMVAEWKMTGEPLADGIAGWLRPFPELAGVLCNCATLREALQRYVGFRDLIGNVDWVLMHEAPGRVAFDYILEGEGRAASCALGNFGMLAGLARFYDPSVRVAEIAVVGAPLAAHAAWGEVLGARADYDQPRNRLVFESANFDRPFVQFNETLAGIHLYAATNARQRIRGRTSFAQTVERQLGDFLREDLDDAEQESLQQRVCDRLSISRWTLQRRLHAERVQFSDLVTRVRISQARHLLLQTRLPIGDIAERMHFASPSAFSRFFTRACGIAPSQFRSTRGDV